MNHTTLRFFFIFSFIWILNANKETITIPLGDLYFTDGDYPLQFDLDLNGYFSNAKLLEKNTILMEQKCTANPNITNCDFFHSNFKQISELAQRETQYLTQARKKRAFVTISIFTLTAAIISAIVGFFVGSAVESSAQTKTIADQINLERETRINNFNFTENQFSINNHTINTISNALDHLHESMLEEKMMNQLLSTTLLCIDKHNKDTERYLNALSDNLASKFFTIIPMNTFSRTIQNLTKSTPSNARVFSLSPNEIIQISTLQSVYINNTIRITILIPVLPNAKYTLFNLIPTPTMRDNTSFILNLDAKFLIQKNKITKEIPIATLAQCIKTTNLTICNSLLMEQLQEMDKCIEAHIDKKPTIALCTYKTLQEKYQIIRLTDESIFVYVIKPISLRISCGQRVNELNITKSVKINFERECRLFKKIDNLMLHPTVVKLKSISIEPKFLIRENNTWSEVKTFFDQYNVWNSNLYHEFRQIKFDFQQRAKIIEIPNDSIFSKISNYFSNFFDSIFNGITEFVILYFILPLIIIIIITMLCICCCRK